MKAFDDNTTMKEMAIIIVMDEIAAIHRDFDESFYFLPKNAKPHEAAAVRKHLAKLHDDWGTKMKFDFVPLG